MKPLTLTFSAVVLLLVAGTACERRQPMAKDAFPFLKDIKSAEDFEARVIRADGLVAVDFFADWCGPCRELKPILNAVAEDWQGKVQFFAVNIDRHEDLANQYGVNPIPDVRFFSGGRQLEAVIGNRSREFWEAKLRDISSSTPDNQASF